MCSVRNNEMTLARQNPPQPQEGIGKLPDFLHPDIIREATKTGTFEEDIYDYETGEYFGKCDVTYVNGSPLFYPLLRRVKFPIIVGYENGRPLYFGEMKND